MKQDKGYAVMITSSLAKIVKETKRPFRIWDARSKCNLPHRCYATERRALDSALILIRWAGVGETFEVYDARTGKFVAAFTRRVASIAFTR